MNFSQKQYELSLRIFNPDSDASNYFSNIDLAKSRKNPYSSPQKYVIRHIRTEPFKDFYVLNENKKLKIRLDSINNKPVEPLMNNEYIELEQRIKINKEKNREIYKKVLIKENEKFSNRVFMQKPRIISTELLKKMFIETHDKYIEQMKSKNVKKDKSPEKVKLPKIILPKISSYKNWNAELRQNKEIQENSKSKEIKGHEHKEIRHQKPGVYDEANSGNDMNNNGQEQQKEEKEKIAE